MEEQVRIKTYELDAVDLIDKFMHICRELDQNDTQFIKKLHRLYDDAKKLGF